MKTPTTLNVGLIDNLGSPVNVHTACLALESYGFSLLASRVFESTYEGNKEQVLVASALYRGGNLNASLLALAINLRQDCVAIYANEVGALVPPIYEFDPSLFITLSGNTLAYEAIYAEFPWSRPQPRN